jgi:uncharacterized protein
MSIALHPQEVEVFYILPAIRKELSIVLKAQGRNQKEIAKMLGVTEAAVSQYLNAKRATDVSFPHELKEQIRAAAAKITDPTTMITQVQTILATAKQDRFICKMHEQVTNDIPRGCDLCFK